MTWALGLLDKGSTNNKCTNMRSLIYGDYSYRDDFLVTLATTLFNPKKSDSPVSIPNS